MALTYDRDPTTMQDGMLLFTAIARDYETARHMATDNLSRRYKQPCEPLVDRYGVLGTPEQCIEKLATFIEAGISNLVRNFTCPPDQLTAQIEWCAAELLPRLRLL